MASKRLFAVAPGDADPRPGSASLSGHMAEKELGPSPELGHVSLSWDYARQMALRWEKEKAEEWSGGTGEGTQDEVVRGSDLFGELMIDKEATALLHHVLGRRAVSGSGGPSASTNDPDVHPHPCSTDIDSSDSSASR